MIVMIIMASLLIIDDDVELCIMLRGYLRHHDMRLEFRHAGAAGLRAVANERYDLILMDVMLPDLDGFELLRRFRKSSEAPVILLTGRSEAADRIHGLQLGADDYLPKPFNPDELVERIRAILRRQRLHRKAALPARSAEYRFLSGDLVIDLTDRSARHRGVPLNLTDTEFALLQAFLKSPGAVLDREELMIRILDRPFHPLNRTLDMHVSRLRRKLYLATRCNLIKTVRSAGYLFSAIEVEHLDMKAS
jgi:DNA-binding response OmpR family regulator